MINLSQSQKQNLSLSSLTLDSLKLLSMPLDQLQHTILEKIETNPFLTLVDNSDDVSLKTETNLNFYDPLFENSEADLNYDSKKNFIENTITFSYTLQDHLNQQIDLLDESDEIKKYLYLLSSDVDDNGFVDFSIDNEIPSNLKDKVFNIFYNLDPVGVGAHNEVESLIIQAKIDNKLNKQDIVLLTSILEDQSILEKLNKNNFEKVAKLLNSDVDTIVYIFDYIKSLNLHPGLKYTTDNNQYIIIDAQIKVVNNKVIYILNNNNLLDVNLDQDYLDLLEKKDLDKKTKKVLENYKKDALLLKEQLDFRKNTLEKVLDIIIDKQKDYFLHGTSYLKPLTQTEVASILDLHPSTISRIANDKYIKTDYGVKRLKELFTTEVNGNSQDLVLNEIKAILEENKGKKLSDQKISDILASKNILVKRRTVNKYRNKLL